MAVGTMVLVLAASTSTAQEPKVEVSAFIGQTWSEGFKTAPGSLAGAVVEKINPTNGFSFGLGFDVFMTENVQVGFQWSQQDSTLELVAMPIANSLDLADMKVNN